MSIEMSRIERRKLILQGCGKGEGGIGDWISFSRIIFDCKKLETIKRAMYLFRKLEQCDDNTAINCIDLLDEYSSEERFIALYCLDAEQAKDLREEVSQLKSCRKNIKLLVD